MQRVTRLAVTFNLMFLVVAILLVPFILFGSERCLRERASRGWCVVGFGWVGLNKGQECGCLCGWPVEGSRGIIAHIGPGVIRIWG